MSEIALPETTLQLVGHKTVEHSLLQRALTGKLPHALLFTGPRGIGKATMAFRLARFLHAGKDREQGGFFTADSLAVEADHPVVKRIASGGHSDLMVLRPAYDEKKDEYKNEIQVEAVRKFKDFMNLTPAESRWRIAIIDSADQLNIASANALLKVLEEPPGNTLLMLISHQPGKLLPTIRSRCQRIDFKPLQASETEKLLALHAPDLMGEEARMLHLLSAGSAGLALELRQQKAGEQFRELLQLLKLLPQIPAASILEWADNGAGKKGHLQWKALTIVVLAALQGMIAQHSGMASEDLSGELRQILSQTAASKPLDYWLDLWENAASWLNDAERLHLDRKQVLISILHAFEGQVLAA